MVISKELFVEFAVDDAEEALDFYERVFDWASLHAEGPIEYHVMGPPGEEAVVGILPTALAPHTLIYFQTDAFDDVVERVEKYGGRVLLNQRVEGVGFVAQWMDPQGNLFAATCDRLPEEMAGDVQFTTIDPERVSRRLPRQNGQSKTSVRPVYVEIAATDARGALEFYEKAFDWRSFGVKDSQMPFYLAGQVGGRAMAGIMPTALGPKSLAYFETDNVGERAQRIRKLGGRVARLQRQEGVGVFAHAKDPFGNPFGLVEFADDAPLAIITEDKIAAGA
jgi:predicted enzyme related to lactoylglutathione lyase